MTEEEIILEQSLEVPTVAVKRVEGKEGGKGEETCPVCMELFNQIYKQVTTLNLLFKKKNTSSSIYVFIPNIDLNYQYILYSIDLV